MHRMWLGVSALFATTVASAAAVVLFVIILALTMIQRFVTRDKEAA